MDVPPKKVCSVRHCMKEVEDENYKMCQACREKERVRMGKKRERYKEEDAKDPMCKRCSGCLNKISRDELLGPQCVRCKYLDYGRRALKVDRKFELTKGQFGLICRRNCFWCEAPSANGIDRRDNTQGYTEANSVPCCETCNFAKGDLPEEKFIEMCVKVAKKHGGV